MGIIFADDSNYPFTLKDKRAERLRNVSRIQATGIKLILLRM
jgi:hypothetical protein